MQGSEKESKISQNLKENLFKSPRDTVMLIRLTWWIEFPEESVGSKNCISNFLREKKVALNFQLLVHSIKKIKKNIPNKWIC